MAAAWNHGGVDSFPVGLFPQRLLNHGLDVEMAHCLFEDIEAVERDVQVGHVCAEDRGPFGGDSQFSFPS
jgi:hypothetical protein